MIDTLSTTFCTLLLVCWANTQPFNEISAGITVQNLSCSCTARDGNRDYLTFTYNSTTSIVAVFNNGEETAVVFDSKNNLTAVISIRRKIVIIISEEGSGIYSNNSDISRRALENLTSLRSLYERYSRIGTSFNVSSVPPEISKIAQSILESLSGGEDTSLRQLVELNRILRGIFSSEFSRFIPSLRTPITVGYQVAVVRLQFLSESSIASFIISNRINLNLGEILYQSRGARILVYLLQVLSSRGDIRQAFGNSLNSTEGLLRLLWQLEGRNSRNEGRFINVLLQIVLLAYGRGSIQNVTSSLVYFYGNSISNNSSLGQNWLSSIQELRGAIEGLGLARYFPNLARILSGIQGGQWLENGFNLIPAIAILLRPGSRGSLNDILNILLRLKQIAPVSTSAVQLFEQYINLLNSTQGIGSLSRLLPGLINAGIQGGLTFAELFALIPGGFLRFLFIFECGAELGLQFMASFWRIVPVIGDIFASFDTAASNVLHESFGRYLEQSSCRVIVQRIVSFIRRAANNYLQASSGRPGSPNAGILPFSNLTGLFDAIPQGVQTFQQLIQGLPFANLFTSNELRCPKLSGLNAGSIIPGLNISGNPLPINVSATLPNPIEIIQNLPQLPLPFLSKNLHSKQRNHHSRGKNRHEHHGKMKNEH